MMAYDVWFLYYLSVTTHNSDNQGLTKMEDKS